MMRYIKRNKCLKTCISTMNLVFNIQSSYISIIFTNRAKQCLFPLLIKALQLVPPVCPHVPFH